MSPLLWIILAIIVLIVAIYITAYNGLQRAKVYTEESWSQIDVQLKRRNDLIPNLVETVKGYAKHEKETLEGVINARNKAVSAGSVDDKINADNEVTEAISRLFALTESYPELKANTNFLSLQEDLKNVENELAGARKYYNAAARDYNYAIAAIPDCIVAKIFKHKAMNMFSATEEQRKNVKVEF